MGNLAKMTCPTSADTLNLDAMRESIAGQVGDAPCSSPTVCRTLAMGAKPCGGPREYLVYSVSFSDSARLATEVTAVSCLGPG
jgi:hypothetical protein